jgi:serine/threonine protein phosphatase PrpC
MEDFDLADQMNLIVNGENYTVELFGVFDGHEGAAAATYAKNNFLHYLKEELKTLKTLTDVEIADAIKNSLIKLDADYPNSNDGTTANLAIFFNGKIYIANVGDSRAIFVKNDGSIIQASEDAFPGIERYKKKIEKHGGNVRRAKVNNVEVGSLRVNGMLNVARAIGDKHIVGATGERCVSPKPEIADYSHKEFEGGYLILVSDGITSVANTDEIGQCIVKMAREGETEQNMAKRLVYSAIQGSSDNVTAIVIKL